MFKKACIIPTSPRRAKTRHFPSAGAARRTASRISDATSVRAGEMVSRQCLEARHTHYTRPPRACQDRLFYPWRYVASLSDARNKAWGGRVLARQGEWVRKAFFNILLWSNEERDDASRDNCREKCPP
jgi:hypothetical protein